MRVLLSIKPAFAEKIFDGTKKFEFRRSIFKRSISRIIVYASAPVSMVIGEFDIEGVLFDDLDALWEITKQQSGISRSYFYTYFRAKNKGYAIKIGNTYQYTKPQSLLEKYGVCPPQSFLYIYDARAT